MFSFNWGLFALFPVVLMCFLFDCYLAKRDDIYHSWPLGGPDWHKLHKFFWMYYIFFFFDAIWVLVTCHLVLSTYYYVDKIFYFPKTNVILECIFSFGPKEVTWWSQNASAYASTAPSHHSRCSLSILFVFVHLFIDLWFVLNTSIFKNSFSIFFLLLMWHLHF